MKRTLLIAAVLVGLLATAAYADSSVGSAFGTLTTARSIGAGRANFGAGVGIGDNGTSVLGQLKYGLSTYTDGRLKFALFDPDGPGDLGIALGGDFKWQFWSAGKKNEPLDLGTGMFLEYIGQNHFHTFEIGGQILGSYPFDLQQGGVLSPYGRFNVRIEAKSYSPPAPYAHASATDIAFGFNGGVAWEPTKVITLFGEFQIDGNDGVFFGIDFNIQ